jgi:hypothetical protein
MSVLAFLGGMGGGYLTQKDKNRQNEREDARDAMQAQRFAWEKDDAEQKKLDRADAQALEAIQREALSVGTTTPEYAVEQTDGDGKVVSAPQASAGDAEFTAFMNNAARTEGNANASESKVAQNYSVLQKDGTKKTFTGLDAAKQAADFTKANPISDVDRYNYAANKLLTQKGGVQSALAFKKQAQEAENLQLDRDKRTKELQNENVFDALRFANTGNAQGVYDAFNKSGLYKFEAVPKLTKVMRDVKGLGKIATYDIEGTVIDQNGNKQPFKNNNFDMGMSLLPYMDSIKTQAALNAAGDKSEYNANLLKLRQEGLATQQYLGQLRAETARANKAATAQVGLSDIRTFNSDFANLLPKPADDINADPAKAQALQDANLDLLTKGQTIFQTNASFGSVLTAPVVKQALRLSQNPKNIYEKFDTETNRLVYFVNVGNTPVAIKSEKEQTKPVSK